MQKRMISAKIDVIKLSERDKLSQKCKLHSSLMYDLRAGIGDYISIESSYETLICKVYPLMIDISTYIQADDTVSLPLRLPNTGNSRKSSADFMLKFKLLPSVFLQCVRIQVILTDAKGLLEWKKHRRFEMCVFNIIRSYGVLNGCIVKCEEHPLAQLCYIHALQITETFNDVIGKIAPWTKIEICEIITKDHIDQNFRYKNIKLGGMTEVISLLKILVTFPSQYPETYSKSGLECQTGILIVGPTGCGKSTLVKKIAYESKAYLINVEGSELAKFQPGEYQASVSQLFQAAKSHAEGGCIIFIDDIDSIIPAVCGKYSHTSTLLEQLLTAMDDLKSTNVVVIAATNKLGALDPCLRRPGRFDKEIHIGVPTCAQREDILKVLALSLDLTPSLDLLMIARKTPGYVGADLRLLCKEALFIRLKKSKEIKDKNVGSIVTMQDFEDALLVVKPEILKTSPWGLQVKPIKWESIGGMEKVKKRIQMCIEWPLLYPEAFSRLGLPRPRGVLLFGPPGCCKTTIVRAVATECNSTFLSVNSAQIYSPFVGDSEQAIVELFHQARLSAPAIIFLDELDSLVGKRAYESRHRGIQEKVLSVLLNEMDGVGIKLEDKQGVKKERLIEDDISGFHQESVELKQNDDVVVVAATNRPDLIDDALLRPGRFDIIIYVPAPDRNERESILESLTRKIPLKDVDLHLLAEKTKNFSGADLANLCKEAAHQAIREEGFSVAYVHSENFYTVLQEMQPSIERKQVMMYEHLSKKYGPIICT